MIFIILWQAPAGYNVRLWFADDFGVYCHYHDECFHWVEVKYKDNLGDPGPRFCCYQTPSAGTWFVTSFHLFYDENLSHIDHIHKHETTLLDQKA